MRSRGVAVSCLAVVATFAMTSCASSDGTADDSATFADATGDVSDATAELATTLRDEGLSSIATAVETVDIGRLVDSAEFTFLAPSDEAFQDIEADDVADLLSDPQRLTDVLRNHVITEKLSADDLADRSSVEAETGRTLEIDGDGGALTIGGAAVSTTDLETDNGTIHVVDRIFLP